MIRRDFLKTGLVVTGATLLPAFSLAATTKKNDWIKVRIHQNESFKNQEYLALDPYGKRKDKSLVFLSKDRWSEKDRQGILRDNVFYYEIVCGKEGLYGYVTCERYELTYHGRPLSEYAV